MSMAQQYASYLERESHKAATPVKAEAMRQAANKLYELDREVARLRGIEHRIEDAISVDVDVVVPTRDYATMTPKDCYEAGMLDGGTAVREAIRAALTPNAELTGARRASELNAGLGRVLIEDKAAVFDALVREFQGKGRFLYTARRAKEIKTGPYESEIVCEDYPVYEFVMRVDGHGDFLSALLQMLKRPNGEVRGASPEGEASSAEGATSTVVLERKEAE